MQLSSQPGGSGSEDHWSNLAPTSQDCAGHVSSPSHLIEFITGFAVASPHVPHQEVQRSSGQECLVQPVVVNLPCAVVEFDGRATQLTSVQFNADRADVHWRPDCRGPDSCHDAVHQAVIVKCKIKIQRTVNVTKESIHPSYPVRKH